MLLGNRKEAIDTGLDHVGTVLDHGVRFLGDARDPAELGCLTAVGSPVLRWQPQNSDKQVAGIHVPIHQRIAGELARKYNAETRSSLEFIRSPDGVLLTSLEARMAEWDTFLGAMLSSRTAEEAT